MEANLSYLDLSPRRLWIAHCKISFLWEDLWWSQVCPVTEQNWMPSKKNYNISSSRRIPVKSICHHDIRHLSPYLTSIGLWWMIRCCRNSAKLVKWWWRIFRISKIGQPLTHDNMDVFMMMRSRSPRNGITSIVEFSKILCIYLKWIFKQAIQILALLCVTCIRILKSKESASAM